MDTRTIGELRINVPDLDPGELRRVDRPPDADLTGALVERMAWPRLILDAVQLISSQFTAVDLTDADWRRTAVHGCRFERVDFSGARLSRRTIERCEFIECRMTGISLTNIVMRQVIFENCKLDSASWTDVEAIGPVGMTGCDLGHALLRRCRLAGAAMVHCRFAATDLVDCDLRGADLRGSDLADIAGVANLRGAIVSERQLRDLGTGLARDLEIEVRGD